MSDFYHLQFGFTGMNGTMLARMAKRNELDNMYNIFDIEGGYSFMMQRGDNPEWLNRNLGSEYMFNEILFKHWPANMWIQTPLDCLDKMRAEHGFKAQEIESIYITPGFQFRDGYRPEGYRSVKDGQFSIPYCLAAYLLGAKLVPIGSMKHILMMLRFWMLPPVSIWTRRPFCLCGSASISSLLVLSPRLR